MKLALVVSLTLLALSSQAYAQDVAFIENEMVTMARWVNVNTPEDALIASHDIGAIGYFTERPSEIANFGQGGLSYYGALLGGLLGLWLWCWGRRQPLAQIIVLFTPALAIMSATTLALMGTRLERTRRSWRE